MKASSRARNASKVLISAAVVAGAVLSSSKCTGSIMGVFGGWLVGVFGISVSIVGGFGWSIFGSVSSRDFSGSGSSERLNRESVSLWSLAQLVDETVPSMLDDFETELFLE